MADSIEMTRVLETSKYEASVAREPAIYSPDGTRFVIRTRRGDLARNVNVESLLVFESRQVRSYLSSQGKAPRPAPRTLVQVDVSKEAGEISRVRWLSDWEIGYIAEDSNGRNQAFAVDVFAETLIQLTFSATDVANFATSGDNVLYYAMVETPTPDVVNLTDKSIVDLVGPANNPQNPIVELFATRRTDRVVRRIEAPAVRLFLTFHQIWMAPSGRYAVTFAPATNAPLEWAEYEVPNYWLLGYTAEKRRSDPTSWDLWFRTRYQLVDLETLKARPLLAAPSGAVTWNRTPPVVFWPEGERTVVVSNTYLSLQGASQTERQLRRRGPAVAEVDLHDGTAAAILWEPMPTPDRRAGNIEDPIVSIDWNGARSILRVEQRKSTAPEVTDYIRKDGTWLAQHADTADQIGDRARIYIKEGMNDRPRVYASGRTCACSLELYDPAPQADGFTFGRTEVVRWKDRNDMEWVGGLVSPTDSEAAKPYPLVVMRGFDPDEFAVDGARGVTTAMAAQPLVNAGIAVLMIQNNAAAITLDRKEAELFAEGYRAGIEHLTQQGIADRERVGLIAHSRAGMYVVPMLAKHPDLLSALTISDGAIWGYLTELWNINYPSDVTEQIRRAMGEAPNEVGLTRWIGQNPLYELPKARAAVRLEAMGILSLLTHWEHFALLKSAKRPVDFIYYPTGQHVLMKPTERLASQGGNVDWFRFWLQGAEDRVASKADQYARWRHLRALADERKGKSKVAEVRSEQP